MLSKCLIWAEASPVHVTHHIYIRFCHLISNQIFIFVHQGIMTGLFCSLQAFYHSHNNTQVELCSISCCDAVCRDLLDIIFCLLKPSHSQAIISWMLELQKVMRQMYNAMCCMDCCLCTRECCHRVAWAIMTVVNDNSWSTWWSDENLPSTVSDLWVMQQSIVMHANCLRADLSDSTNRLRLSVCDAY